MTQSVSKPEERYASLAEIFLDQKDVTQEGKGFGSTALKVNGKIFAMLTREHFVVKLPRQREDALVASGEGERFDRDHGRVMTEWLSLEPGSKL